MADKTKEQKEQEAKAAADAKALREQRDADESTVGRMLTKLREQTDAHNDLVKARGKTRAALRTLNDAGAFDEQQSAYFAELTAPKSEGK